LAGSADGLAAKAVWASSGGSALAEAAVFLEGVAFLQSVAFLCAAGLLACTPAANDAAPGARTPSAMAKKKGRREEVLIYMAMKG
jgi:hypothetical protein